MINYNRKKMHNEKENFRKHSLHLYIHYTELLKEIALPFLPKSRTCHDIFTSIINNNYENFLLFFCLSNETSNSNIF